MTSSQSSEKDANMHRGEGLPYDTIVTSSQPQQQQLQPQKQEQEKEQETYNRDINQLGCAVKTPYELTKGKITLFTALFDQSIFGFCGKTLANHSEIMTEHRSFPTTPYIIMNPMMALSIPQKYVEKGKDLMARINSENNEANAVSSRSSNKKQKKDNLFSKTKNSSSNEPITIEAFQKTLPTPEELYFETLKYSCGHNYPTDLKRFRIEGLRTVTELDQVCFLTNSIQEEGYKDVHQEIQDAITESKTREEIFGMSARAHAGIARWIIADSKDDYALLYTDPRTGIHGEGLQRDVLVFDSGQQSTGKILSECVFEDRIQEVVEDSDKDNKKKKDEKASSKKDDNPPTSITTVQIGDSIMYDPPRMECKSGHYYIRETSAPAYNLLAIQHSDISANNLVFLCVMLNKAWKAFLYALNKPHPKLFNIGEFEKFYPFAKAPLEDESDTVKLCRGHFSNIIKNYGDVEFTPMVLMYMYRKLKYCSSDIEKVLGKYQLLRKNPELGDLHVSFVPSFKYPPSIEIKPEVNATHSTETATPAPAPKAKPKKYFAIFQNVCTLEAESLSEYQMMESMMRTEIKKGISTIKQLFGTELDDAKSSPFFIISTINPTLSLSIPKKRSHAAMQSSSSEQESESASVVLTQIHQSEYAKYKFVDSTVSNATLIIKNLAFCEGKFVHLCNLLHVHLFKKRYTFLDIVDKPALFLPLLVQQELSLMDMMLVVNDL